jgi:hypothetical protein
MFFVTQRGHFSTKTAAEYQSIFSINAEWLHAEEDGLANQIVLEAVGGVRQDPQVGQTVA